MARAVHRLIDIEAAVDNGDSSEGETDDLDPGSFYSAWCMLAEMIVRQLY